MTAAEPAGTCGRCGTQLTGPRHKKYCDDTCRSAARRRRDAERSRYDQNPFARVLDQVLAGSARSTRELAEERTNSRRFYVSAATLSEWRHGLSVPYRTEDNLVRVLDLARRAGGDPGALVAGWHETAPRTPGQPWWRPRRTPPADGPLAAARAELEHRRATNRCRATIVRAHDLYDVGELRKPESSRHTLDFLALEPDLDGVWVSFVADDNAPLDVKPVSGCALGRRELVGAAGYQVHAIELRWIGPLRVGASRRVEIELVNPPHPEIDGLPWPGCLRIVEDPACRELVTAVRFADDQQPKQVWAGTWRPGEKGVPEADRQEVAPLVGDRFELHETDLDPGMYGIRWRWPTDTEPAAPRRRSA